MSIPPKSAAPSCSSWRDSKWREWRTALLAIRYSPFAASCRLLRQPVHLAHDQLAIVAVASDQVVRCAVLDGVPFLQDDDAIEAAQGREPMRDRDHGTSLHQRAQGF